MTVEDINVSLSEADVLTDHTPIDDGSNRKRISINRPFKNSKEQVDAFIQELKYSALLRSDPLDNILIGWSNSGNGYSEEY